MSVMEVKKYPTIFECIREASQSGYELGKQGKLPRGPFGEVYKEGFLWNHFLTDYVEMKYQDCWNIGYSEYQKKRGATFVVSSDFQHNMKVMLQAFSVGIEYYIALYSDEDSEGMAGCDRYCSGHCNSLKDDEYIHIGWVTGFNYAREAYNERGLMGFIYYAVAESGLESCLVFIRHSGLDHDVLKVEHPVDVFPVEALDVVFVNHGDAFAIF